MAKLPLKYIILPTLCLGAIALALYTYQLGFATGVLGGLGLVVLLACAKKPLLQKKWKFPIASLILLFVILQSSLYMVYGVSRETLLLFSLILWLFVITERKEQLQFNFKLKSSLNTNHITALAVLVGQSALLYKLIQKTTEQALGSPWLLVGKNFFLVYGLTLFALSYYLYKQEMDRIGWVLLFIHGIITFSVISIIYTLGFGYDPFLHRAAQEHIFLNGSIDPKTPFYIGQYVSTVGLAHLLHIPLKTIDIWFTPLLSAITLPVATWFGLSKGLSVKNNWARIAALLVPLYPLQAFVVTTPHNVATLLTLILILITPAIIKDRTLIWFGFLLAGTAAVVHPLSGIFAAWLWIGLFMFPFAKKGLWILYGLIGSVLSPLLFSMHFLLKGTPIGSISNVADKFDNFISLFQDPYYFIHREAPAIFDAIYVWRLAIPVVIGVLAIVALWYLKEKKLFLLLLFPFLMLSNMLLIATWITVPELSNLEQIQYAERLRHIMLLFVLPLSLYGIIFILQKLPKKILFPLGLSIAVLVTGSWYLTYPQRNPIVHFPGYNVTRADMIASSFINDTPEDTSYVVLSSILTAAASIEQFGFDTYYDTEKGRLFYYSIPAGSPLYTEYSNMLYEGQKREYMVTAMELTNVDRAYFVLNSYWANAKDIIEGAKKTADSWQSFDNESIWVFTYDR